MNFTRMLLVLSIGVGAAVAFIAIRNYDAKTARLRRAVAPVPYFPPGDIWTQDVSSAPLDPESSAMIDWLAGAGGWGTGKMRIDFSLRVMHADSSTPYVTFQNGPEWMPVDSDSISKFPLPANGGIEGMHGYQCPVEKDDCHLLVEDSRSKKLYEAYQANYANGVLTANFVAVWNLNRIYPVSGRGDQCTSADAAGYPIAPLLFNADELATGRINHAIRFVLPNQRIRAGVFVHPATHAGAPSGPASAPPYGSHLRLKASYNLSQLKPAARIVARAMQKYGILLSDGGNIALTAQSDEDTTAKYDDVGFDRRDLQSLDVTDFEVLKGGEPTSSTGNCIRNP